MLTPPLLYRAVSPVSLLSLLLTSIGPAIPPVATATPTEQPPVTPDRPPLSRTTITLPPPAARARLEKLTVPVLPPASNRRLNRRRCVAGGTRFSGCGAEEQQR